MKNRPERLICFLVVWLTMFSCIWVQGQTFSMQGQKIDFLQVPPPGKMVAQTGQKPPLLDEIPLKMNYSSAFSLHANNWAAHGPAGGLYAQPADLYYIQSGFFCKREWEMEKATHLPIRFRLGSLADCNALEGKH
jgi:hypothetical protein